MRHTATEISLKNGAKGIYIHVPGATVMSLEVNFRAGDFLTPENKWETAHLMEHLLLGANEQIPRSRAFQAEFEKTARILMPALAVMILPMKQNAQILNGSA